MFHMKSQSAIIGSAMCQGMTVFFSSAKRIQCRGFYQGFKPSYSLISPVKSCLEKAILTQIN